MRAILVIDEMPKNCDECPYCGFSITEEEERACLFADNHILYDFDVESGRWECCPLKPMPQEKVVDYSKDMDCIDGTCVIYTDRYFAKGWNACLEEIEK